MRVEFEKAWRRREQLGVFGRSQAVRVFHGPGEGSGDNRFFAVDRYQDHYWVTQWEEGKSISQKTRDQIVDFYRTQGAISLSGLIRPERSVAPESQTWWGATPKERFSVRENTCQYWIQFEKTRHPGLFLDHEPLRRWLLEHTRGWNVLNTFAYTGSLSVAAGLGGARSVTTLDLAKPTIQWAKDNMELNGLLSESHRFYAGDVFEWLPRWKKDPLRFDCIILDPPSFSHGKKGRFSTSKDLEWLHSLAMDLLTPDGVLVTSINSANVSWKKYEADVLAAARSQKMSFSVLKQIDMPETFPTALGHSESRYLKGWILRRS